ncbi:MAG: glycosyltransferase family 4 protein [Pseudonocardiales bacterium]
MKRTRVALICGYLDPTRDGVADYTRRLAVHLRRAGLEPLVLTTHEHARAAGDGVVGVCHRWDVLGVATAVRAMRRLHLDLVHVQFAPSAFDFSRAVGLLPLFLPKRVPLVVTLHEYGVCPPADGRPARVRSTIWSAVERRGYADRELLLLMPRADRVLLASPEHLDVLRTRWPCHVPAALEVPIGINVQVASGGEAQVRTRLRRGIGAAPDAPVVVFFGFLHPDKGLADLIAAMAVVRVRLPGARLILAGGAESHSVSRVAAEQLRQELERVAAACGMQDHLHFTGYLPDEEVSRLLQAADAAAFPFPAGVTSKSSSLLTALAAGLPVVATAPPGEVRGPTEAGGVLRVPPSDSAALTTALLRVLTDRALAGRLTEAARVVVARHSWDAIAAEHAEAYAHALRFRPRPSAVACSGIEHGATVTTRGGDTDVIA